MITALYDSYDMCSKMEASVEDRCMHAGGQGRWLGLATYEDRYRHRHRHHHQLTWKSTVSLQTLPSWQIVYR